MIVFYIVHNMKMCALWNMYLQNFSFMTVQFSYNPVVLFCLRSGRISQPMNEPIIIKKKDLCFFKFNASQQMNVMTGRLKTYISISSSWIAVHSSTLYVKLHVRYATYTVWQIRDLSSLSFEYYS